MGSDHRRTVDRVGGRTSTASGVWRFVPAVLVTAPAAGLVIAAETVDGAADPTTTTWMTWSAIAAGVFVLWFTAAIWFMVGSIRSSKRPVFIARWTSFRGYGLVALAGLMTLALVLGDPFGHVIRNFQFGASDVVDLGLLAAIIVSLVAGGAALLDASDHRRAERAWPDHM